MMHLALHLLSFHWAHCHHHFMEHRHELQRFICFMGKKGQPGGCVQVP